MEPWYKIFFVRKSSTFRQLPTNQPKTEKNLRVPFGHGHSIHDFMCFLSFH